MHDFSLFYSPFSSGLSAAFIPFIALAALWTIILKGYALWFAARGNQKWWFIALLIINTLGILEIVYLIWFRPGAKNQKPASSTPTTPTAPVPPPAVHEHSSDHKDE